MRKIVKLYTYNLFITNKNISNISFQNIFFTNYDMYRNRYYIVINKSITASRLQ